jgi:aryl-alcohol dehydrogenase-like predicted oxidoreductase
VRERSANIPALGFGCSSLTGTSRRVANRVLAAALDSGIRHFDVARYYGYGEAERILGEFLEGRRSEVTITTKFGIEPPKRTRTLNVAMGIGRQVVRALPGLRRLLQGKTQKLVKMGAFNVRQARVSLETSLRELRTDYIDFYLLHDYAVSGEDPHDLLMFLEGSVKAGKIGSFGIGTSFENVLQIIGQQPGLCRILQFPNSVLTGNIERLPRNGPPSIVITHGALGESYRSIRRFLETHRDSARNWSAKIRCDLLYGDTLSSLMLSYAANANRNGYLLFSSRNPSRVSKNAKSLLERRFSAHQINTFRDVVNQESAAILAASAHTMLGAHEKGSRHRIDMGNGMGS